MEIAAKISSAINKLQSGKAQRSEIFKDENAAGSNEFLFFIKPEICMESSSINREEILNMILKKIDDHALSIRNIIALPGSYLRQHNIIAQHYGVINAIAGNAEKYLTRAAKENFESLFGISIGKANVLGGIQFADKYPELSATAIDYIWQNTAVEKLGGGAYAGLIKLDGDPVYLVNGFHPRQLEHFIAEGRSIIALTLCGETNWSDARNKLIGKTNPNDAESGSIRKTLLENKDAYGLQAVSSSWNGVHLSAGPLEGLIELIRYNSDFDSGTLLEASDFSFGKKLLENFSKEEVEKILSNPEAMYKNKRESLFDLTEELNSGQALALLKEVNFD